MMSSSNHICMRPTVKKMQSEPLFGPIIAIVSIIQHYSEYALFHVFCNILSHQEIKKIKNYLNMASVDFRKGENKYLRVHIYRCRNVVTKESKRLSSVSKSSKFGIHDEHLRSYLLS